MGDAEQRRHQRQRRPDGMAHARELPGDVPRERPRHDRRIDDVPAARQGRARSRCDHEQRRRASHHSISHRLLNVEAWNRGVRRRS